MITVILNILPIKLFYDIKILLGMQIEYYFLFIVASKPCVYSNKRYISFKRRQLKNENKLDTY